MKILIFNTCILNNGDALLVTGLLNRLREDGHDVVLSDMNTPKMCKKKYPNHEWKRGVLCFTPIERKLLDKCHAVKNIIFYARALESRIGGRYDVIISAPGGYINQFYGFEDQMHMLSLIKKIHKAKLVMYSQSVGPLNKSCKMVLDSSIKMFDLFMARDEFSYSFVKDYKNVLLTNDAAFLNKPHRNINRNKKTIGISVREWIYDGRNLFLYMKLIQKLVVICVENGYHVEFISTCQGIEGYRNDGIIAEQIVQRLDAKIRNHVDVNSELLTVSQLRSKISGYHFVIGTRLHMCVLSILSGVPAFNISYEKKGIECYRKLDWDKYSCDYNEDIIVAEEHFKLFLDNIAMLKKETYMRALEMHHLSEYFYDVFKKNILDGDKG